MKVEFTLKAKEMDKKWHKAIKKLFGKKKLCVTVRLASEDDDDWWEAEDDEDDDWFLEWDEEDQEEEEEAEEAKDEKAEEKEEVKEAEILEAAGVEVKEETPVVSEKPKTTRGRKKSTAEAVSVVAEEAPVAEKRTRAKRKKAEEVDIADKD